MERRLTRFAMAITALAVVAASSSAVFAQSLAGDSEPTRPTIQVDPEIDSLLTRADQLAARKEFDLAATLWQKLLDESGHHLLSDDGERFVPLREYVFRKLAALPPAARAVYRITADGEARGLLEATADDAERREIALAETVRRFFMTSIGDDAAFELAGLALDRRDFVTASRLTRAILQRHPDPNVPLAQVLLRQAVADAYLGDRRGADVALDRLAKLAPRDLGGIDVSKMREYLAKEIYPRRGAAIAKNSSADSRSTSANLGAQPDLPSGVVGGPLTEHLVQEWSLPEIGSASTGLASTGLASVWVDPGGVGSAVMYSGPFPMIASSISTVAMSGPSLTFEGTATIEMGSFEMGMMGFGGGLTPHASLQSERGGVGELTDDERRAALAARWRERLWHPTMQLLPVSGGLVFRSNDEVTRWDLEGGRLKQRWQSPWKDAPLPTGPSPMTWSDAASRGALGYVDSMLFGDGLALAMSAHDELLFVLEGPRTSRDAKATPADQGASQPVPQVVPSESDATPEPAAKPAPDAAGDPAKSTDEATPSVAVEMTGEMPMESAQPTAPSRQRKNFLVAYEQKTGKQVWRRAADDEADILRDEKSRNVGGDDAGFVGPPLAWHDRVLVPVLSGGSYALLAMNVADGKTLWQTPLGDEPDSGANLRSACCVAIAGGDAYVVLGTGMVYALDVRSGAIHWGTRYARDVFVSPPSQNPYVGHQSTRSGVFHGWDSDVVIVSGNSLVVLASDHDYLLALDRRTGDVKWRSPRRLPSGTSARYCLGVLDRRLFVAGVDVVRAYDLPSGRLEWEQAIRPTSGRGALTSQAIYLPILGSVDAAVLSLDPRTGRELGQTSVTLTRPEPLGNLVSDGQRLWVAGANRLYALTHVPHQLQELSRGVDQRRSDDVVQRARLLARLKRFDEALADIRLAHELLVAEDPNHASAVALELLVNAKLSHERPLPTLQLIAERQGFTTATTPVELVRTRDQLTRAALGNLQRKPIPASASELLRIVPNLVGSADLALVDTARVIESAARAIDRAASSDDLPVLREALQGADPWRRLAAIPSLVARGGDADLQLVEALLASDNLALRRAAATSLVLTKGRRSAIATLIELANSDDVTQRRQALATLRRAAGDASPAMVLDSSADERARGIAQWKNWHASLPADLPAPIVRPAGREVLDRILLSTASAGRLAEYDAAGREVWHQSSIPMPSACAGTSEGHRLVLTQAGRQFVEFDAQGEQVWQSGILPFAATSLERLPDGNTLLACPQRDVLLEIAPDGHLVATTVVRGNPASARRVDDRRTLVALSGTGRVAEVTRDGETIWEAAEWPAATDVQRLPSGQTLVTQPRSGVLTLLDRSGQNSVWQRGGIKTLVGAVRDAKGVTVLADAQHLEMLGPDGRSLWTQAVKNITGISGN